MRVPPEFWIELRLLKERVQGVAKVRLVLESTSVD